MPRPALRLAAALAALLAGAARADTLIDNVEGVTFDEAGRPEPLVGLVIGTDGRVVQVLHRGEAEESVSAGQEGTGLDPDLVNKAPVKPPFLHPLRQRPGPFLLVPLQ